MSSATQRRRHEVLRAIVADYIAVAGAGGVEDPGGSPQPGREFGDNP